MLTLCFLMTVYMTVVEVNVHANTERFVNLQNQVEMGMSADNLFHQFKVVFRKTYKGQYEEQKRKMIFQDNFDYIRSHNARYNKSLTSYKLGINEFSDLSHQEFLDLFTRRVPLRQRPTDQSNLTSSSKARTILPMTIDWRGQGYKTPVRAQGLCGACWAFITAESIEGQLWRRSGKLTPLSVQQLVDCSKDNGGCTNGYVDLAYSYVMKIGGLEKESDYPYAEKQSECKFDRKKIVPGSKVYTFNFIPPADEEIMKEALANIGPLAASIDASHRSFQMYKEGIYDEPLCSDYDLNHGGLVVGYGNHPKPFWLLKNSWGPTWGEAGYIRMARNKNNQCGIATDALYPVLG